ncbi:MAG: alpha/beta hydrolase [Rhodospirillales bacterium]|nr:alpha/beta hydrolase [Rhodospirillales bacterium]
MIADQFTISGRNLRVPPTLPEHFLLPEETVTGHFYNDSGHRLCFGCYIPDHAEGAIIMEIGTNEFLEKHARLIRANAEHGQATFVLERRGHGLSDRAYPEHPDRMGGWDFHTLAEDSFQFITSVVSPLARYHGLKNPNKTLLAVSQGGLVGAHLLAAHPEAVDQAVFGAPMFGQQDLDRLAFAHYRLHPQLAGEYMLRVHRAVKPDDVISTKFQKEREAALLAPDAQKAHDDLWRTENPELINHTVTRGWVVSALPALRRVQSRDLAAGVTIPTLILLAEKDECIDNGTARKWGREAPNAAVRTIPGAKQHDILSDPDPKIPQEAISLVHAFLQSPERFVAENRSDSGKNTQRFLDRVSTMLGRRGQDKTPAAAPSHESGSSIHEPAL